MLMQQITVIFSSWQTLPKLDDTRLYFDYSRISVATASPSVPGELNKLDIGVEMSQQNDCQFKLPSLILLDVFILTGEMLNLLACY